MKTVLDLKILKVSRLFVDMPFIGCQQNLRKISILIMLMILADKNLSYLLFKLNVVPSLTFTQIFVGLKTCLTIFFFTSISILKQHEIYYLVEMNIWWDS